MHYHLMCLAAAILFVAGCVTHPTTGPKPVVVHPHVSTDRSIDCSTADRILDDLIDEGMSDEERVVAVFNWIRRTIYHGDGLRKYAYDFHKTVNVFGYGSCARQTTPMAFLLGKLGYRSRNWTHRGHHMIEVFYDGKWHCFDPHMTFYVYDRSDPPTIASIEQLQADPTLAKKAVEEGRACPGFLLCGDSPLVFAGTERWKNHGEFPDGFHRLTVDEPFGRITLRRGEAYVRTWMPGKHWFKKNWSMDDNGPFHTCQRKDRKDTVNWPLYEPHAARVRERGLAYRHWGAGELIYAPDLSTDHYRDAVVSQENLELAELEGARGLTPADPDELAEIVFSVNCPYAVTAGTLLFETAGAGSMLVPQVSTDRGGTWQDIRTQTAGRQHVSQFVDPINGSLDGYWIRLRLSGPVVIRKFVLITEFQLNPYSLPHLVPGRNVVNVEADAYGAPLTVAYAWSEGPDWKTDQGKRKTFREDGTFTVDVAGDDTWPRMRALTRSVAP